MDCACLWSGDIHRRGFSYPNCACRIHRHSRFFAKSNCAKPTSEFRCVCSNIHRNGGNSVPYRPSERAPSIARNHNQSAPGCGPVFHGSTRPRDKRGGEWLLDNPHSGGSRNSRTNVSMEEGRHKHFRSEFDKLHDNQHDIHTPRFLHTCREQFCWLCNKPEHLRALFCRRVATARGCAMDEWRLSPSFLPR